MVATAVPVVAIAVPMLERERVTGFVVGSVAIAAATNNARDINVILITQPRRPPARG